MNILFLVFFLVCVSFHNLSARVVNGYEKEVEKARLSILHLHELLDHNPQFSKRHKRQLMRRIRELRDLLVYHALTDTLLCTFGRVSPDIYRTIDTLRDHRGRPVDVYVKFIARQTARMPALGSVVMAMTTDGQEVCISPYGRSTVSVTIAVTCRSMMILSHEFGHISYMVPALPRYLRYYRSAYRNTTPDGDLGHKCSDPGGRHALIFEGKFRRQFKHYLQQDPDRRFAPFSYVAVMRRQIENSFLREKWRIAGTVSME